MKILIRSPWLLSPGTQRFIRWSRALLFICGSAALAYVGVTLLNARLYQVTAKHSLETQIRMVNEPTVSQVKAIVKEGDVLGRIDIPRLRVSVAVLQGTKSRTLRLGVGHIETTPLPGDPGNSGIAGHRDTFFRELKDIHVNDEIQLQTANGLFRYEVDWVKVVEPHDTTVLNPSTTESTLTFVTCYPFYFLGPAPDRFVVHARKQ